MTQHTQPFWFALGIWYFLGSELDYMPKTSQVAWVKVEIWTQMKKHGEETQAFPTFWDWWWSMQHCVLPDVEVWTFHHERMDWKYSSACCSCEKGNAVRRVCILRKSESPESPSNLWSKRLWDPQAGHCFSFFTERWENAYMNQVCAKQCL